MVDHSPRLVPGGMVIDHTVAGLHVLDKFLGGKIFLDI